MFTETSLKQDLSSKNFREQYYLITTTHLYVEDIHLLCCYK